MKRAVPPPGWTTPAAVVRVIDGDTLVVRITRDVHIRLLDCWCPESRTKDLAEKELGLAAKAFTQKLIEQNGPEILAYLAGDPTLDLARAMTMGRMLGRIYLQDGRELSTCLRKAGHATRTKRQEFDKMSAAGAKGRYKRPRAKR